jgi:uncharacterized membrane protein YuzA (DUF378 family)
MNSVTLHIFAKFLLILGSIHYLFLGTTNMNIFSFIKSKLIRNIIFILIGVCGFYFMFNRDYYLPFLDKCVMPVTSHSDLTTGSVQLGKNTKTVSLSGLPVNTRVIFWGAQTNENIIEDPQKAYGDFINSGIVQTDQSGSVTFNMSYPSEYKVPTYGKLKRHLHYRYELPEYRGMWSRVYTQYIS